ncbi:hypothetical protein D9619_009172 [Psilocybe cf. subviscida]|uniref:HNH nuclease domain-containing protein n=1 Tax=Psilocybe cf. subviscida TaxID=2480587 RepID=A0A8H5BUW3_9AGAR|nr:hypothetical protein D9619_009172 [Psilocybe cf. subviscida]
MTDLPGIDEMRQLDDDGLDIWTTLLEAEKIALHATHAEAKYLDPLIAIRIVGFLILNLWTHANDWNLGIASYISVKDKVESCRHTHDWYNSLVDLGLRYRNHLLRVFRSNEERRSTPSPNESCHESKLSFEATQQQIVVETKNSKCSTRKQALLRDGFKCAITGFYDLRACRDFRAEIVSKAPGYSDTKAAHLFSEASVLSLLEIFGLQDPGQSLHTHSVNGLQNVITLESRLQMRFDNFELWLEPVGGQEHTYNVCKTEIDNVSILGMPIPPRVTLRVDPSAAVNAKKEGLALALPDPLLMAVRAVCVRVCNLSGATEHMEKIMDDLEDSTVISDDQGAALLGSRLSMYMT